MQDLQDIIDDLADRIHRGVAIDDRHLRLIVHAAHDDTTDPVRRMSILTRRIPDEVAQWVFSIGIEKAQHPVHVPAAPKLGAESRLVVPIRGQGLLLGFLTVLDPDQTLAEAEIVACEEAAAASATVLYRQRLMHEAERLHELQLAQGLLSADGDARDNAALALVEEGRLSGSTVVVIIVRWTPIDEVIDDDLAIMVGRALDRTRRAVPPRCMLEILRRRSAVVIADVGQLRGVGITTGEFAGRLLDAVRDSTKGAARDLMAGVGSEVGSPTDAEASREEAQRALRVATHLRGLPQPASWEDLGAYRMLSLFPPTERALSAVPAGCRELFSHPSFLHTAERYLDLACDAKATAQELSLHRASLYYRLAKAEKITGLSFKNGDDRLTLHMGIRLLRLAGVEPANVPGEDPAPRQSEEARI